MAKPESIVSICRLNHAAFYTTKSKCHHVYHVFAMNIGFLLSLLCLPISSDFGATSLKMGIIARKKCEKAREVKRS